MGEVLSVLWEVPQQFESIGAQLKDASISIQPELTVSLLKKESFEYNL